MLRFQLNISPTSQQRHRSQFLGKDGKPLRNRCGKYFSINYDPSKKYKEMVRLLIVQKLRERYPNFVMLNEPLEVNIVFIMPRPLSAKKKFWCDVDKDLDNLSKAIWDAMNKVVYFNDSRIVKATVEKVYPCKVSVEGAGLTVGVRIEIKKPTSAMCTRPDWADDFEKSGE